MYDLANFIPYLSNEHKVTNDMHRCLAWSKALGYYFTQIGFCVDVLIVAIEEV